MAFKNYYEVLGVPNFATNHEVREGYRVMAAKYNSDTNLINEYKEELLKDVNEAIDVLSNVEKKREFDKTLRALEESMKGSLREHLQKEQKNTPEVEHIIEMIHKYFDKDKVLREKYENLLSAKSRTPGTYFSSVKVIFVLIIFGITAYFYNPAWFNFIKGTDPEERRFYEWVTIDETAIYAKSNLKSKIIYTVPKGFGFNTISETVHFYKVAYTDSTGRSGSGFVRKKFLEKSDELNLPASVD